jgi:hypothetical protein
LAAAILSVWICELINPLCWERRKPQNHQVMGLDDHKKEYTFSFACCLQATSNPYALL